MSRAIAIAFVIAAAATPAAAAEFDLTPAYVRNMIGAAGINEGTRRDLGPYGVRELTQVTVARGRRKGDFVVHLHIVERKKREAAR